MSIKRQLQHGARVLAQRDSADHELDEEIQHYYDETTKALMSHGMSEAEARRTARMQLGSETAAREEVRAHGWEHPIGNIIADLRYAARGMRTTAGFSLVVVLTLALGIGASTAIFSAVKPILFDPLPYPHADRIVTIADLRSDRSPLPVTFGSFMEIDKRSRSFDVTAVSKPWQATLLSAGVPERLDGQRVSAAYFRVLGVAPAVGRDFDASEDVVNGANVVMLSDKLWRSHFGGDPSIVGRQVRMNDAQFTVVGVMPPTFEDVLSPKALLWAPLQYDRSLPGFQSREWGHHLQMIGRLRADRDAASASRELATIARNPTAEIARPAWANLSNGIRTASLKDDVTRGAKPALIAVLGAVVVLLLIACVNVTNLLLARGARRRSEFAMRAALGAGRARMMQQVVVESFLYATVGGLVGMFVAQAGIRALLALSPAGLPRASAIRLDGAVFGFALVITTIIGLLVGLVPAIQTAKGDLQSTLSRGSRRVAGAHQIARRLLVIAEISLALVLLVSAGLLLRSMRQLFDLKVGFDAHHVMTMQVVASPRRYPDNATLHLYFEEVLSKVRAEPGVVSAAFTSQLPLSGDLDGYGVHFEKDRDASNDGAALRYAVTPDYFQTMHIPLISGRNLGTQDAANAPRAVLINESFAKRVFPKQSAIGQRLRFGPEEGDWYTIVGVVGDVTQGSLAGGAADALYVAPQQWHWVDNDNSLVVKTRGKEAALTGALKRAVWSVDREQAIVRVATLNDLVAASESQRRFAMILFEAFAAAALALAAIGIYGLLSGTVTERFREIGVRTALGATRAEVVRLIVGQGMMLTSAGIGIGVLIALAATRALATLLFGISRVDVITYAGVIALLGIVTVVACTLPAWRAARINPSVTLRAE